MEPMAGGGGRELLPGTSPGDESRPTGGYCMIKLRSEKLMNGEEGGGAELILGSLPKNGKGRVQLKQSKKRRGGGSIHVVACPILTAK